MSFFEKLKKSIGIEEIETKKSESKKPISPIEKKEKLSKNSESLVSREKKSKKEKRVIARPSESFQSEGQLALDVCETDEEFIIQATIAGVNAEDLDISIEKDLLTIRGERKNPLDLPENKNYLFQECYWGPFSRKIILPEEVDPTKIQATMKRGILTLRVPKISTKKRRKIMVREE